MADFTDKEVLLRVEHLCQYFKLGKYVNKAVDDVSFEVHKGEVFGLVGESGCGKTTTGRSIIKIYDATSGSVYFKGQRIVAGFKSYKDNIKNARKDYRAKEKAVKNGDTTIDLEAALKEKNDIVSFNKAEMKKAKYEQKNCDKPYAERHIAEVQAEWDKAIEGITDPVELKAINKRYKRKIRVAKHEQLVREIQMIFQDPIASLDPRMTVRDIISEGLIIKGIKDKKYIDEQVFEMLEKVGLVREHSDRYPHEFSGGQRQRIGIARAIVMHPEMIIADEPISALDVSIQAQVINLLNDLRKELDLTILFIAHDLSVVKYFSDRIGVMYYGKMVELASSEELFAHPLHPYTRSLLSAIPLPDPEYEKKRKRITYNPIASHDYSQEKPTFREILPGHFVLCNSKEEEQYRQDILEMDKKKK